MATLADVRHTCDNPPCINVRHLVVGSHADNMADKVARNRQPRGAQLPWTKLSAEDALAIRDSTEPRKEIAARFGVNVATVDDIRHGRTWRHI